MIPSLSGSVFSSSNSSFTIHINNLALPGCRRASRFLAVILPFLSFILLSAFQANATPKITLMTPQEGPVGTVVVIIGSGFGTTQGSSTVTFNGTPVTWVSWGSSTLQVEVPVGATTGNVIVKVSGVSSNSETFTVTASPVITSLSQTSGAVGSSLTITGSGFSAGGTQTPQVVFNPQLYASPTTSSDTSATVTVPLGATTGDVLVSVGGGDSNGVLFTVTSSDPSISSISPSGGVVGTSVTITGSNFGSSRGSSTVTFNGTTGTPTSWSATRSMGT
jgi:IPT/TIG domain